MGNPQRQVLSVPGAAKAKPVQPSCGGCQCFSPPPQRPGADPMALKLSGADRGECRRFPQMQHKLPSDFCFEFIATEVKTDAR